MIQIFISTQLKLYSYTVGSYGSQSILFIEFYLFSILARINILKAPKDYSCTTDCLNTISHVFDCVIDTDPYQSTYFVQTWELNGIPVSKMTKDYQQSKFIKTEDTKVGELIQ